MGNTPKKRPRDNRMVAIVDDIHGYHAPPESLSEHPLVRSGSVHVSPTETAARGLRKGKPADLAFVDKLQRKFGHSVGFLCKAALAYNLEHDHVDIAVENGEPAGYLLGRPRLGWCPLMRPIYQACVAMDAQRRHHGLALLLKTEGEARASFCVALQANCAVGVEANEFWKCAGFKPICHMTPKTMRGRHIICWRKPLVRSLPPWFMLPPARSGHMARRPVMEREAVRKPKAQKFAERFIAGAHLVEGDPSNRTNGLHQSISEYDSTIKVYQSIPDIL